MGLVLLYCTTILLKPLSVLKRQVNAAAGGDMEQHLPLAGQDEIGDLAGAFARMQNVMQDKINQLNKSEKKYRELIQHAHFVILRWDKDGRILYLNEYGRRLFGFTREELLGHHVVGTIVARTESTSGRDLSAMIDEILHHPDAHAVNENENMCKDGSRVWIQWNNNAIFDDEGRFIEMLSVGINITERKKAEHHLRESESRYRALFESASDAILIRDENCVCIDCNAKALELFGCPRNRLIGSPPHMHTPDSQPDGQNSAAKAQKLIARALTGEPQSLEWQIRRHDGEIRDLQARVSYFVVNEKKYVHSVLRDITRQKRMEVELRQAQKMEGIGTLAGGIAHDFNNILSAIIGYTELAQMKISPNSDLAMDLNQVRKASERARGLVRQILAFSRKQKHDDSVLQINLIVKEALKLIRSSIPTTIEIEQNLACRAAVRTDPTLIHQLVMNLCTNAFQAMEETGGKLTVSMSEVVFGRHSPGKPKNLREGRYVQLEVRDTGCGMPREILDKIFDPFFTTKEQDRGTGLGLAVVHDIVKDLSGGITVESEPGDGTTFRVLLPVAEVQDDLNYRPDDNRLPSQGSERIMVVDDEAAIRNLMESILTKSGYRVDLFGDGKDAWQAFSCNPHQWNLIITDQTMPKMTGAELAVRALKIRTGLPVIICTGYSESISLEKAHELGIRTFLHKPVSLNELLAAVHEALKNT
jgi:two-component system, cell cycle sensor histidine kinase and response regulator CckA